MKQKIKRQMDAADFPGFLRELAEAVEGRTAQEMPDLSPGFEKLAIKAKAEQGRLTVKVKAAFPEGIGSEAKPSSEPTAAGAEKYKHLKKRLKEDFKQLCSALEQGTVPDKDLVDRFLADSEAMTAYPGYGDEYYPAYREACARLGESFAAADLDGMRGAYRELESLKDRCHKDHK